MNLGYVFSHGDPVLIATFLILIVMSFASWYVILLKFFNLRAERKYLNQFNQQQRVTLDWAQRPTLPDARGLSQMLIKQTEHALPSLTSQPESDLRAKLSRALGQSLDMIRSHLDSGLTVLASIGSSAPFIGLFGTVWGVYGALMDVAAAGNASLAVVAGPMGEALVATAMGLFAAIPAMLAYNAFVRKNRLMMVDYRHIAEDLASYVPLKTTDRVNAA